MKPTWCGSGVTDMTGAWRFTILPVAVHLASLYLPKVQGLPGDCCVPTTHPTAAWWEPDTLLRTQ